MTQISKEILFFLKELSKNNSKDWMTIHKKRYQINEKILKEFYAIIQKRLNETDRIEKFKVFRINRDIRFSKDKTLYNIHRSVSFTRAGIARRGGYYLRIEPGNKSMLAGGFFKPEPKDLLRIRQEFQIDTAEIRSILKEPAFVKAYSSEFVSLNPVKTAPKGFSKEDPNIDLIRLKNFFVSHSFTDAEIIAPDFGDKVITYYRLLQPFFDYMSEVLITDLNGVSLLD